MGYFTLTWWRTLHLNTFSECVLLLCSRFVYCMYFLLKFCIDFFLHPHAIISGISYSYDCCIYCCSGNFQQNVLELFVINFCLLWLTYHISSFLYFRYTVAIFIDWDGLIFIFVVDVGINFKMWHVNVFHEMFLRNFEVDILF